MKLTPETAFCWQYNTQKNNHFLPLKTAKNLIKKFQFFFARIHQGFIDIFLSKDPNGCSPLWLQKANVVVVNVATLFFT